MTPIAGVPVSGALSRTLVESSIGASLFVVACASPAATPLIAAAAAIAVRCFLHFMVLSPDQWFRHIPSQMWALKVRTGSGAGLAVLPDDAEIDLGALGDGGSGRWR